MKCSCILWLWAPWKGRFVQTVQLQDSGRDGATRDGAAGEQRDAWSNSPCNSHLPQPIDTQRVQFKRDATMTQQQLWDFWEAGDYKMLLSVTLRNWRNGSRFLVQANLIGTSLLNLFTHHSITSILHTHIPQRQEVFFLAKEFYFRQKKTF